MLVSPPMPVIRTLARFGDSFHVRRDVWPASMIDGDAEKKKGTGLMNIVRRAKFIDGHCEVVSEPGKGTTVTMQVPY